MPAEYYDEDGFRLAFDNETPIDQKHFFMRTFPTVNKIVERRVHCTSCDVHIGTAPVSEAIIRMHPVLRVTHCRSCHAFYNSGEFDKGEDGSELYCRWCGQGGEVYCCSNCPYVFCKKCITRNLSRSCVQDIVQNENWHCFSCAPHVLWTLQAHHWALENFIEKQKKEIKTQQLSSSAINVLMKQDRTYCCLGKGLGRMKGNSSNSSSSSTSVAKKVAAKRAYGDSAAKRKSSQDSNKSQAIQSAESVPQLAQSILSHSHLKGDMVPSPSNASISGTPSTSGRVGAGSNISKKQTKSVSFDDIQPHVGGPPAKKKRPGNDEVVCTPDIMSMLSDENPSTSSPAPVRPPIVSVGTKPMVPIAPKPTAYGNNAIGGVPSSPGFPGGPIGTGTPTKTTIPKQKAILHQTMPRNIAVSVPGGRASMGNPAGQPEGIVIQEPVTHTVRVPSQAGQRQTNAPAPLYTTFEGFRIDLQTASQQGTYRLPNGKVIVVRRQAPDGAAGADASAKQSQQVPSVPPGGLTPIPTARLLLNNALSQQQHQQPVVPAIIRNGQDQQLRRMQQQQQQMQKQQMHQQRFQFDQQQQIQLQQTHQQQYTKHLQRIQQQQLLLQQQQPRIVQQMSPGNVGGRLQRPPMYTSTSTVPRQPPMSVGAAVKGTPDSTQSDLTNIHPYSIVNVLTALVNRPHENTELGNAQKDFEKAMLAGAEVCKHILAKIASLAETKSHTNVRNLRDVKELFIHMSYLVTYGIGRFKTLHERCVNDVKKMGFTEESDFVMMSDRIDNSTSAPADSQEDDRETPDAQNEEDDDDDDCKIIEQQHTIIEVDSDDDEPAKEEEKPSEEVSATDKSIVATGNQSTDTTNSITVGEIKVTWSLVDEQPSKAAENNDASTASSNSVTTTTGEGEKGDGAADQSDQSVGERENLVEEDVVAASDTSAGDEKNSEDGAEMDDNSSGSQENQEFDKSAEDKNEQVELIEISDKEVSELLGIHTSNDEEASRQNSDPSEQTVEPMEVTDSDDEAARTEKSQNTSVVSGSNGGETIANDKAAGMNKLFEDTVKKSKVEMEENETASKADDGEADPSAQQKDTQGSHNDTSLLDELEHSSKGSSSEILNLMDAADDSYHSDSSDMQFTADFIIQEVNEEAKSKREATVTSTCAEEEDGADKSPPDTELNSPTATDSDGPEPHCTKPRKENEEAEAIEVLDSSEEGDSSKNTTLGDDDEPKDAPVAKIVEETFFSASSPRKDQTVDPVVEEQVTNPAQKLADDDTEALNSNVESCKSKLPKDSEQKEKEMKKDEDKQGKEEGEKENKEEGKKENEDKIEEIEEVVDKETKKDDKMKTEFEEKEEIAVELNSKDRTDKDKEVLKSVDAASFEKDESLCESSEQQNDSDSVAVPKDTVEISSSSEDGCEQEICANGEEDTSQISSKNDKDVEPMEVDSVAQHSSDNVPEQEDKDQTMKVADEEVKDFQFETEEPDSSIEKNANEIEEKVSMSEEGTDVPQVEVLSEESSHAGNDSEKAVNNDEAKQKISEEKEAKSSNEKPSHDSSNPEKIASSHTTTEEAADQQREDKLSKNPAEDLPASSSTGIVSSE